MPRRLTFSGPKRLASRKKQTAQKKEWKLDPCARLAVLDILRDLMGIKDHHTLIDVALHRKLKRRAENPEAAELLFDGTRGLVIMDDAEQVSLMYLPWAIPQG